MAEPLKLDRTWLCSVVFVDIVQYSLQSLEVQAQWKRRFNEYLAEALKEGPESDRVILDTGDGAAICFLGDPETAMFCALRLMAAVAEEKKRSANPLRLRAGINLGSVKLVRDINGNPNAVGDGINVGQRVMSFAADNQILVSRSFYEVASSLSESYAELFKYEGVHKDKHVREHILYELHPPAAVHRAPPTVEPPAVRVSTPLAAEQTARVESQLALILGPIARHLVRNAGKRAGTVEELRDVLLAFIPVKPDQEKFLKAWSEIVSTTPPAVALSASAPAPAPVEKAAPVWEPAVLERARKDLAVFIGPLARVLVERTAAKVHTREALYQSLAGEINSARDRETFLKQASVS
jgi:class 3 adenylate cyclase